MVNYELICGGDFCNLTKKTNSYIVAVKSQREFML